MKIAGIIAEYNPFHTGHAYHIQKTRELTGADYIIVVLSGDFVQRGAPALYSKHLRTRIALLGGADLVFELPSTHACESIPRPRNASQRVSVRESVSKEAGSPIPPMAARRNRP